MKKTQIVPLAIDLGAKHTAVYKTSYPAFSSLKDIHPEGTVYHLEKNQYTLLMTSRTASRHQRRGYDRRQMVKRLLRCIWTKHLNLPWDNNVEQTFGFLLNRRGFSFLTEEYNSEVLENFPQEAYDELPKELKKKLEIEADEEGRYNFSDKLSEWQKDNELLKKDFEIISHEPKRIAQRLVLIGRTKELKEYCDLRKNNKNIPTENPKKVKLSQLSPWIFRKWKEELGIKGLETVKENEGNQSIDMVFWLNKQSSEVIQTVLDSLSNSSSQILEEEKKIKDSIWNFNYEKFDTEKFDTEKASNSDKDEEEVNVKNHLHHLVFALSKIKNEQDSGARHRSKYFEEIKNVFKQKKHSHKYLTDFVSKLQNGNFSGLTPDNLTSLIGHISNLELKPLRKYFNDKKHTQGDYWDESRLSEIFRKWILKEWRVGEKDRNKKAGSYKELKDLWEENKEESKNSVVKFWLKTNPVYTIPPYQNVNNRRPPRCQSLILQASYLDQNYPDWEKWLKEIKELSKDYIGNLEKGFTDLKSGKGNHYFEQEKTGDKKRDPRKRSSKDLNTRVMQFVFDRVKDNDPLKLNEIYSHTKKIRQNGKDKESINKAREALEKALKESSLPNWLKVKPDYETEEVFPQKSFIHLICHYYKLRQRARDGRIFIYPKYKQPVKNRGYESTGYFESEGLLLSYCNHKPRQKKYQLFNDLAGLLRINSEKLKEVVDGESEKDLIKKFKHLKTNCGKAAEWQKKLKGGLLKIHINKIKGIVYYNFDSKFPNKSKKEIKDILEKSKKEIKDILKKSKVADAQELYNFYQKAISLCLQVTEKLYTSEQQEKERERLEGNPAAAVYLLAQLNNLVFKERSGNAKTCAVCSLDNAKRMELAGDKSLGVKAQRLPAIATRIIDGAVKRMARILSNAIIEDNWNDIEKKLKEENIEKVHIPIIIESNRFEFEPNLKDLKGKKLEEKDKKYRKTDLLADKNDRIKQAAQGVSAYSGNELSGDTFDPDKEEVDHIIPRSSQWGILNDEANLICVTIRDNQAKGEKEFSLKDLSSDYKKKIFKTTDDKEIESEIEKQLKDDDGKLKFKKYNNFVNIVDENDKKAFRHALFLVGNSLRKEVISVINNRNRALVNGTQRYFVETIANAFYRKTLKEGLDKSKLSFDYFEVEAWTSGRGAGVKELREEYQKYHEDLLKCAKEKGEKQNPYSHLLDAQFAFMIAAYTHKQDGSLKLNLDDKEELYPSKKVDQKNSNYDFFSLCEIKKEDMKERDLQRRKPDNQYYKHRSIFRDGIYAERYVPILIHTGEKQIRAGFDWKNSVEIKVTPTNLKKICFVFRFTTYWDYLSSQGLIVSPDNIFEVLNSLVKNKTVVLKHAYFSVPFKVKTIHEFYIQNYPTSNGYKKFDSNVEFLRSLSYRTEKKSIREVKDVEEVVKKEKNFEIEIEVFENKKKLTLPIKQEWENLREFWRENEDQKKSVVLKKFFKIPEKRDNHEKTRKVFSLPIKTEQGKILIKRKSWNEKIIYQILNDSDSRTTGNKFFLPAFNKETETIEKVLSPAIHSKNAFLLENSIYYDVSDQVVLINPKIYFDVSLTEELKKFSIKSLYYCIDNNTRPRVKIVFSEKPNKEDMIKLLSNNLLKPEGKGKSTKEKILKEVEESESLVVKYTGSGKSSKSGGSGFNKEVKKILTPEVKAYYM